jgi:DNA gyrase subunit A
MPEIAKNLLEIDIQDEMRFSYLDYSMSVIIGRALPDVRDGLKPVHRRILYAMFREGNLSNRRYSKCAGVVGEVLKKYHPHGDSAVYDSLVRMAQPWNMRVPLVDGQGNFGSVDGDPAAAYRYTECRMKKVAELLLSDIDKDTVDFSPNFDGSTEEPVVLPAAYPNLLVNGSDGIAVGMATKIPPHNLGETIDACVAMIDDPEIPLDDLMKIIPGPDFPTAGHIYGKSGIRQAYETGRGRVVMRGNVEFEEMKNGKWAIIIDELPFQVNKARLVEEIANLVKHKKVDGITALRDESDRNGMRVVVELRRDAVKEVILNHLYRSTALQNTFGINMLAIVNNRPMTLGLKDILSKYISHRRDVTMRRCQFDLRKTLARLHLLEGYLIALDNIDEVIRIVRSSKDAHEARPRLMETFGLSEIQAQAILDMRLQRLTGLERDKIVSEQTELEAFAEELRAILASETRLMQVIKDELVDIRNRFADPRRTNIEDAVEEISILDLIEEEEQVITLSVRGYIKRMSTDEFQEQRRGGKGKRGVKSNKEDAAQDIFIANTKTDLLIFTTNGVMYKLPVYKIPETSRNAAGTPVINLVPIDKEDSVASVLSISSFDQEDTDLVFCSTQGLVKRTALMEYRNVRSNGLRAYNCADGDQLLTVKMVQDESSLLINTIQGKSIHFKGSDVRRVGRIARGVRGIRLQEGDSVASMVEVTEESSEQRLLTITENGYGKRTALSEYRLQNRGGVGIIDINTGVRNGAIVGSLLVDEEDKIMLISENGIIIKIPVLNIRDQSRNTKGVTVMKVPEDDRIVSIVKVLEDEEESSSEESSSESSSSSSESSEELDIKTSSEENSVETTVESEISSDQPEIDSED